MWRVIAGLIVLHIFLTFVDGIIVGQSDLYVTKLTATVSDVTTTIPVQNTEGWRAADYMWIGDEKISYNGKTATSFLNATRGYDDTTAEAHTLGVRVYARASDAVRTSAGYNVLDIGASAGAINMGITVVRFMTTALPQLVTWNYSFLKESNTQYIRMILVGVSTGFVIYLLVQVAIALGGIAQGMLRRP